MKTRDTDTVLFKLRVSATAPSSPSTSASWCPASSRRQEQRTVVFNGISANSWLLPIGIAHKDCPGDKPPGKDWPGDKPPGKDDGRRPKRKNSESCHGPGSSRLEPELPCTKTADEGADSDGQDDNDDKSGTEGGDPSKCDDGAAGEGVPAETDQCTQASSTCAMTSDEFDSIWKRVSQRPHSTGSVFIVRRRNLPVGLGKHEYLQGQHLRSKFEEEVDGSAEEATSFKLQPRPFTAPGGRKAGTSPEDQAPCWRQRRRPFSHTGVRGRGYRDHRPPPPPAPINSSIDLVVTSFHVSKAADSARGEEPPGDVNEDAARQRHSAPRPKTTSAIAGKGRQREDPLDTIDGIKRSYMRRAQSAPPNVRSVDPPPTSGCRGPSLYWRARSAYHKKLLIYGPDDGPDPNEPTQNVRGSLWRPLLVGEDSGVMQHSAGCPYKCKGCFKACLVSEDYLQKARAEKVLREKQEARQARGLGRGHVKPVPHQYRVKVKDPRSLVSIALARSQPIYKLVYRESSNSRENTVKDSEGVAKDAEGSGDVVNDSKDGVKQVGDDGVLTTANDTKTIAEGEDRTV